MTLSSKYETTSSMWGIMIPDDAFQNQHFGQFRLSSEHSATRLIVAECSHLISKTSTNSTIQLSALWIEST